MLRTAAKKEPQGVVYQGVEDDLDNCKDSFMVSWATDGREGKVRAVLVLLPFALLEPRLPSGQLWDGSAGSTAGESCGFGVCAVHAGTFWEPRGGGGGGKVGG